MEDNLPTSELPKVEQLDDTEHVSGMSLLSPATSFTNNSNNLPNCPLSEVETFEDLEQVSGQLLLSPTRPSTDKDIDPPPVPILKVTYLEDDKGAWGGNTFFLPDAAAARKRRREDMKGERGRTKKVQRTLPQSAPSCKSREEAKPPEDFAAVFLSPEQRGICELVSEGYSIFFTGSAGEIFFQHLEHLSDLLL